MGKRADPANGLSGPVVRVTVGGVFRRLPTLARFALGALLVVLAVLTTACRSSASDSTPGSSTAPPSSAGAAKGSASNKGPGATVQAADLPKEAQDTLKLIAAGGPFPYPKNDGVVFGNYEGHLPGKPSGYYHEYTVPTPGSPDRGARRIITGGDRKHPSEYYYTDDHYVTFRQIQGVQS